MARGICGVARLGFCGVARLGFLRCGPAGRLFFTAIYGGPTWLEFAAALFFAVARLGFAAMVFAVLK